MSLLRVCAFATRLNRRSLLDKCAVRVPFVDYCQLCFSTRNAVVGRISDKPLTLQRRNASFSIPKKEDAEKRVLGQSLVDVLEARIQQLQSDIVIDVQHAKVEFIKAPSSGTGVSSPKGPKHTCKGKADIPKSGKPVAKAGFKSQPSRQLKQVSEEEKIMVKKQQNIGQKVQKNAKDKPTTASQQRKSSQMLPGTSHKKILTSAKKTGTNRGHTKLADEICDAVASTTVAGSTMLRQYVSKGGKKGSLPSEQSESDVKAKERSNTQAEKVYRMHVSIQQNILLYLEACLFAGDINRAQCFLLSQHRSRTRRKHLNANIYALLMKVWAKKGSLNQVGRLFILLEEANLKPSAVCYSAALECMGRSPMCQPYRIQRCLDQMEQDGLSVDDLFNQCVFRQDESDMVLKAIHRVKPDYQPSIKLKNIKSFPTLVQDYYTKTAEHINPKLDFTQKELQERFKRQLKIEQACIVTMDSVEATKPVTEHMTQARNILAKHRAQWRKTLLQALRENKTNLANANIKDFKINLYPFLCLLEDNDYVDIMIQCVTNLPPTGEMLMILTKQLGNSVYTKYCVRQKYQNQVVEKLSNIYDSYTAVLAKDTKVYYGLPREQWCNLEREHTSGPTLQGNESHWPYNIIFELGIFLMEMMMKNLKFETDPSHKKQLFPILYHMYTFRGIRQVGYVKPHPFLVQLQQEARETKLTFDPNVIPMLCPPIPWASNKFGAYLLTPAKLMRTFEKDVLHEHLLDKSQNLCAVMDSLNQLGNCAWRINKPLLDIIISIFNDRGSEKLDIPPPMSEAPKILQINPQDSYSSTEKTNMKKEAVGIKKKCSEMLSLRMDALYKLSIANYMRDEVFWFPHNIDFRGRTYPCPPYFNHLGSDVTRAILLFAEGKPLGPKGLDWLKIHLINLTGLKKGSSLEGRLEHANSIMDDILDSADNPLNGKKWWMKADEPWQVLACCMEISNAVRSPDPTQFISHFPVHQDGSCNGLQHYAALGRDVIGATSVNLMPCDMPQDVYTGVAQQVEELRAQDAKNGHQIAMVLEGFISRKVVKQTVMTLVYGVTSYGGRLQIEKRLNEIDEFPKDQVWHASQYLVRQVFSGLKEMFTGAREIQEWLTESARLISKTGHTVEWVTPLGLPVHQPYYRICYHQLPASMQKVSLPVSHNSKQPDTLKQKNAFPPNFIHSLDSAHMMLTSLHCYSAGLTFVAVHDCYWTHAVHVDIMNKICREQFVALHSQPILQDLSNFLLQRYFTSLQTKAKKNKLKENSTLMQLLGKVPQTGDFDINQVKDSTYFFS